MTRYVALLGSINVGGNRLKMADLKAAMEEAGFGDVETVAASGNVLFDHARAADAELEAAIAGLVKAEFGIDTFAAVRSTGEVRAAIEGNPFHGTGPEHGEDKFVHSIFLDAQPDPDCFEALKAEYAAKGSERLALGDRVLFLDYVYGAGVSSLTGPFLRRRLRCRGTARNMRSLKRIHDKMTEAS